MSVTAAQIRELHATGLGKEAIAKQLKCNVGRVTQALERRPRMGRPGGQATPEMQIQFARRIADSTEDEQARALAQQLFERLSSLK